MQQVFKATGAILPILGLMSCGATMPNPDIAVTEVRSEVPPVRTLTNFSEALGCMDDMLLVHKKKFVITSNGLPDATGDIPLGTKEMMITAIANMSIKSKAFKFVDYDQSAMDINAIYQLIGGAAGASVGGKFLAPNEYIRGAITQIDKNVLQDSTSGGLQYMGGGGGGGQMTCDMGPTGPTNCKSKGGGGFGGGIGFNEQASSAIVSVDVNIVDMLSRQILPGMSSSNSVVVTSRGNGLDLDASIKKMGLNFSSSMSRGEGMGAAVRALIELAMIESLGKLAGVPYWKCLGQDSTSPSLLAKARKDYDGMQEEDRIKMVQAALISIGYPIVATGTLDEATKESVSNYKKGNNLIANGRIDFDLYYNLVINKRVLHPMSPTIASANVSNTRTRNITRSVPKPPIAIKLSSNKGDAPLFKVGEDLHVTVGLTQSSFLYCYYQDSKGQVSRVFPNRFTPNPAVIVGDIVNIPPSTLPSFKLAMDVAGNSERIDCLASYSDVDMILPKEFKIIHLQPLPVKTIEDVVNTFRSKDPNISHATLRIAVSG